MAVSHYLHPTHNLTELIADTSYTCDGCRMHGTGTRFRCAPCDFDLHDYCTKCPPQLPSTIKHPHPMSLVVHKPQLNQTNPCKICDHAIQGLAYKCEACIYWIHPLCVLHYLGPPHFLHPSHTLTKLTKDIGYRCNGCGMSGSGMRLRCIPCDFDLHEFCANGITFLPCIIDQAHPMSLAVKKPGLNLNYLCPSCRNPVKGLCYECKRCNYWVHPLCSSQKLGLGHDDESMIDNTSSSGSQGVVKKKDGVNKKDVAKKIGRGLMLANVSYNMLQLVTGNFDFDWDFGEDSD